MEVGGLNGCECDKSKHNVQVQAVIEEEIMENYGDECNKKSKKKSEGIM